MHQTLTAATDCATFVLFDRGNVRRLDPGDTNNDAIGVLEDDVADGRALVCYDGADGVLQARVYLDAEPEESLKARARRRIDGALLRAPTGIITFGSLEDYCLQHDADVDAGGGPNATDAKVPPGNYLADAFEVERREGDPNLGPDAPPDIVLVLRPLPADVDPETLEGIWFGSKDDGVRPAPAKPAAPRAEVRMTDEELSARDFRHQFILLLICAHVGVAIVGYVIYTRMTR